jgi:hypothetical protein
VKRAFARLLPATLVAATLVAGNATAAAEPFTGIVRSLQGAPVIVRAGTATPAAKGARVEKGDTVKTGPADTIGIVFSDDTVLTLGPGTAIAIDDYAFDPLGKQLSFVARILRGTVRYISGQIAKLRPPAVRLTMPAGTIGIRGTDVLIRVP